MSMQQAVDQQKVLDLISELASNPDAAQKIVVDYLVEMANDGQTLESLPKGTLSNLLQILPSASTGQTPSVALKPSDMCNLGVTQTALGTECSFTIPKGMSGKAVLALIERVNPRAEGDGVVWPSSELLNDKGLNDVAKEDRKYTFTVCARSNNLDRNGQGRYLKDNNLEWTDRAVLTLGAALFRDQMGFPADRSAIGTANDQGDLFKGLVVRARSGALASDDDGLAGNYWGDDASHDVVAAGSPN